jgi:hypothetical protein
VAKIIEALRLRQRVVSILGDIALDASNRLTYFNGTRIVPIVDEMEAQTYTYTGVVSTGVGTSRIYVEADCVIDSIRASVGTAPTGAALIVDVNKNGTSVYTTQGNRPSIAAGANTATGGTPDIADVSAGQYLTVDVDQIGSTISGSDLTVTVRLRRV